MERRVGSQRHEGRTNGRRRFPSACAAVLVLWLLAGGCGREEGAREGPASDETTAVERRPATTAAPRTAPSEAPNPVRVAGEGLTGYPAAFAFSPDGSRVAYLVSRGQERSLLPNTTDLHVVDADGAGLIRLTDDAAHDGTPAFSPDGKRIVFHRSGPSPSPGASIDLYVVKTDGTGRPARITGGPAHDLSPTFSPDGERVAFYRQAGPPDVYVMDADGTDLTNLTANPAVDLTPVFSPDGREIAFTSDQDERGNMEVYVTDVDGAGTRRLTFDPEADQAVAFSPSGEKIMFVRQDFSSPDAPADIYLASVDGTDLTRLIHHPDYDGQPAFVPGSNRVAFVSPRDGDDDIYTVRSDGTGLTALTRTDSASEGAPKFSSDGSRMAYASARKGDSGDLVYEIYVRNLDGSD